MDARVRTATEVAKGSLARVPGAHRLFKRTTGGTVDDSARYCYSVWLRHLTSAFEHGLRTVPRTVAELGPGDSLGVGIAALLSGAARYFAFDLRSYTDLAANLDVLDELVALFERRADIPDQDEFPAVRPMLRSYRFPHELLDPVLEDSLHQNNVTAIRRDLQQRPSAESPATISYVAPWSATPNILPNTIDLAISQAVMEHVDELEETYEALHAWLVPGGFMSHVIDYRSHGLTAAWNGHWAYGDRTWRLIRGGRPWLLNRRPHSVHRDLIEQAGFEIVFEDLYTDGSGLPREQLPPTYRSLSDTDHCTAEALIQAVKQA